MHGLEARAVTNFGIGALIKVDKSHQKFSTKNIKSDNKRSTTFRSTGSSIFSQINNFCTPPESNQLLNRLPLPCYNKKSRGELCVFNWKVKWVFFIFFVLKIILRARYIFSCHLSSMESMRLLHLLCVRTIPSAGICLQFDFCIIFHT